MTRFNLENKIYKPTPLLYDTSIQDNQQDKSKRIKPGLNLIDPAKT